MAEWQDYDSYAGNITHSVVGTVRVLTDLVSPQLGNQRHLLVYLPPSYAAGQRRYPVLYMHDGQNLFDEATSYVGEWRVDETLEALSSEGIEAIVVGIPNMGEQRLSEYGPFPSPRVEQAQGDAYLAFLVETVKPLIDHDFRTRPERTHTGVMGSSMGGLISLYAYFRHPDTFGFAGVMSPSLWFGDRAIFPFVEQASAPPGKIYLDVGSKEGSQRMVEDARKMVKLLTKKGYRPSRELHYLEAPRARHHEADWSRRLPRALRLLLGP